MILQQYYSLCFICLGEVVNSNLMLAGGKRQLLLKKSEMKANTFDFHFEDEGEVNSANGKTSFKY